MRCFFHEENEANGVCVQCHRALCCGDYLEGALYCKDHSPDTMKKRQKKMLRENGIDVKD